MVETVCDTTQRETVIVLDSRDYIQDKISNVAKGAGGQKGPAENVLTINNFLTVPKITVKKQRDIQRKVP